MIFIYDKMNENRQQQQQQQKMSLSSKCDTPAKAHTKFDPLKFSNKIPGPYYVGCCCSLVPLFEYLNHVCCSNFNVFFIYFYYFPLT